MYQTVYLTRCARALKLGVGVFVFALCFTTACKKETVTDVAQANSTAPAAASPPDTTQAASLPSPAASPLPNASPTQPSAVPTQLPPGVATPAPGTSPLPGATPDPAPNMKHLNNGKMITVTGKQGAEDFVVPPPPPTPTPAPTVPIVMVNGKIKQQWEAPAEYAGMKFPFAVTPETIKRGKYLYSYSCENCHGAEGKGNGYYNKPEYTQATNLTSKAVQANTDGELFYKVSFNRGRHPSRRMIYSDDERWMIVAYLRTLK